MYKKCKQCHLTALVGSIRQVMSSVGEKGEDVICRAELKLLIQFSSHLDLNTKVFVSRSLIDS